VFAILHLGTIGKIHNFCRYSVCLLIRKFEIPRSFNHWLQETATCVCVCVCVCGRRKLCGGIINKTVSLELVSKSVSSKMADSKAHKHRFDPTAPYFYFLWRTVGQNGKLQLSSDSVRYLYLLCFPISFPGTVHSLPHTVDTLFSANSESVMMIIVTRIDDSFSRVLCILILSPHICDED